MGKGKKYPYKNGGIPFLRDNHVIPPFSLWFSSFFDTRFAFQDLVDKIGFVVLVCHWIPGPYVCVRPSLSTIHLFRVLPLVSIARFSLLFGKKQDED